VARKDKARSMYVTSSDTNIHAAVAGDRNGGIAKVPPTTRDVPPRPAASAAHATVSQPIVSQRCDIVSYVGFLFVCCQRVLSIFIRLESIRGDHGNTLWAKRNSLHAFGYNSAESEPIWI